MRKILLVSISVVVFAGISEVQAQNGFVVWSKGGGCERELHYNEITEGNKVGQEKLVVPKGPGADIWPHISYDGEWIAWARAVKEFDAQYGKCDYHSFQLYDIYIGRIGFGNALPVNPIKVAHGYLPSWAMDENAKTPNKPKALYFTHYETKTIKKTIINPDGTFTEPVVHHQFDQNMGTNAHVQMSPDGKFLLYRPNSIHLYSLELKKNISDKLGGCHPSWGPRSKYFIRSKNGAFFNTGTSVKELGSAGVGSYFHGISNDAYYDEGRLWVIGRIGGIGQNDAGSVEFREVKISNDGKWQLGPRTQVGSGSACDIHMFPKEFDPKDPKDPIRKNIHISENRFSFSAHIKTAASGLQLIIHSTDRKVKFAELFDIQGKRTGFIKLSGSYKNIMSLNKIVNGRYLLKVSGDNKSTLISILIVK